MDISGLDALTRISDAESRSISAENPGALCGGGAEAAPCDDPHCTDAARRHGRGWKVRPWVPQHGLYRWHLPDPVHFREEVRVSVQALGWWPDGTYQPLEDDIASVAYRYQQLPSVPLQAPPTLEERFGR